MAVDATSYRDRSDFDTEKGCAISVRPSMGEVLIELGTMRNFGSMSADAWAALSAAEARELAIDINKAALELERAASRPSPPAGPDVDAAPPQPRAAEPRERV